jgi:hypothetical protein
MVLEATKAPSPARDNGPRSGNQGRQEANDRWPTCRTHEIDEDGGIIHITYTGECDVDELKTVIQEVIRSPDYRSSYHVLSDFRGCVVSCYPHRLPELARMFEKNYADSTGKSAMILDTPYQTAIAMPHQKNVEGTRVTKLFSTREAALSWLESD